jgi:hypothetical protein
MNSSTAMIQKAPQQSQPIENEVFCASPYKCHGLIGDLSVKYSALHVRVMQSIRIGKCTDIIADRSFKLVWANENGQVEECAYPTDSDWRYTFQGVSLKDTDKCYFEIIACDRARLEY